MYTHFLIQKSPITDVTGFYFLQWHFPRYAPPCFLPSPKPAKMVIPMPTTAPIPTAIAIFFLFAIFYYLMLINIPLTKAPNKHKKCSPDTSYWFGTAKLQKYFNIRERKLLNRSLSL